jgi:hypothetical protein
MSIWKDLIGTVLTSFKIGLTGNTLDTVSGRLRVRDSSNAAFSAIATLRPDVSGDTIVLNSESANTYTLRRPASQAAPLSVTFPNTAGSAGQVVQTDGAGTWTYVSAGSTADREGVDTTALAFGDTSPKNMFTLPANAVVNSVRVTIDTAFTGTPTISVGTSASPSKYLASSQVDLKQAANTQFEIYPAIAPVGTTEALQIAYASGGATAGSARVEVFYCNPN